jgi:DNA-directed RNA polymerase subunit N (RpoN/RPB10)
MIIPIRCFTCHKVLADKWNHYKRKVEEHEENEKNKKFSLEDINTNTLKDSFFLDSYKGKILDTMGIKKICCRRHLLGHVDLIDLI